jgi:hypothetical protein
MWRFAKHLIGGSVENYYNEDVNAEKRDAYRRGTRLRYVFRASTLLRDRRTSIRIVPSAPKGDVLFQEGRLLLV